MLTEDLLRRLSIDAGEWLAPLSEACDRYEIDNENRVACFLATCMHESANFTRLVESLHYSPAGLLATWPKRFTPQEAVDFAYDDVRIGERVYGGRMGNGPEGTGDGYVFRGRGPIQITGRAMYRKASANVGPPDFEADPLRVQQPAFGALVAAWIWADEKQCNPLADDGKMQSITLRINGGLIGLQGRLACLDKVRKAL